MKRIVYRNGYFPNLNQGHDFRKDYTKLDIFKQNFPDVPIIALTATATAEVQKDIMKNLMIKNCVNLKGSFNRENLRYEVKVKETYSKTVDDISSFIKKNYPKKSGIVYCFSKNDCEKMKEELEKRDHKVEFYHAGISDKEHKKKVHSNWSKDKVHISKFTPKNSCGDHSVIYF
jgi:bloom syndrome protein